MPGVGQSPADPISAAAAVAPDECDDGALTAARLVTLSAEPSTIPTARGTVTLTLQGIDTDATVTVVGTGGPAGTRELTLGPGAAFVSAADQLIIGWRDQGPDWVDVFVLDWAAAPPSEQRFSGPHPMRVGRGVNPFIGGRPRSSVGLLGLDRGSARLLFSHPQVRSRSFDLAVGDAVRWFDTIVALHGIGDEHVELSVSILEEETDCPAD